MEISWEWQSIGSKSHNGCFLVALSKFLFFSIKRQIVPQRSKVPPILMFTAHTVEKLWFYSKLQMLTLVPHRWDHIFANSTIRSRSMEEEEDGTVNVSPVILSLRGYQSRPSPFPDCLLQQKRSLPTLLAYFLPRQRERNSRAAGLWHRAVMSAQLL